MVDCDDTCMGCNGGWQHYGMTYSKSHPLLDETDYPYMAVDQTCEHDKIGAGVGVRTKEVFMVAPNSKE